MLAYYFLLSVVASLAVSQNVVNLTPNATAAEARGALSQYLSPAYAGFGIEPSNLFSFTGARRPNVLSLNLLYTLANYTGVPPHFRIGGNTQDNMVYVEDFDEWGIATNPSPQGNGQVPWDLYTIGPRYFQALDRFPPGTPITYGLSLAYDFANWTDQIVARANASRVLLNQTELASFEIGNEVNLYLQNEFRNSSWGGQVYSQEWLSRADAVYQQVLKPASIPPNFFEPACTSNTEGTTFGIAQLANQFGLLAQANASPNSSLTYVSRWNQHDYYYYRGISGYNLLLEQLMDLSTTRWQFEGQWGPQVTQAFASGYQYVLREYASVGPTGISGLSDAFGATLWTLHSMLYFATLNISSIQFHMTDDSYSAAWQPLDREDAPAHVRSTFYAFAALNQIIGPGCTTQVQSLSVNSPPSGYENRLGAYAAFQQGNLASLILLNTQVANSSQPKGSVSWELTLPSLSGQTLYLSYLTAAGADAIYNTTWNGISYEQSGTGLPTPSNETIRTVVVGPDGAASVPVRDSEALVVSVGHQIGVGEQYNQTACQTLANSQPVPVPDAVNEGGSPEQSAPPSATETADDSGASERARIETKLWALPVVATVLSLAFGFLSGLV